MNETVLYRARVAVRILLLAAVALSMTAVAEAAGVTSKQFRNSARGMRLFGSAACVNAATGCNTTVSGELTNDDCRLDLDNSFYDAWTFQGTAGQRVDITMAAGFETYLFLIDPTGFVLEENTDHIVYTLEESGTYTIYANSFAVGVTGAYTLQLQCSDTGACVADATTLCLNQGRFRVRVTWRVPSQGTSGVGMAQPLTSDTGYFWFFTSNNVELVIKVVDGRAFNNHFWVFYGALSDVEYTITVFDTEAQSTRTYSNPQGRLASVADTAAFRATGTDPIVSSAALDAEAAERARLEQLAIEARIMRFGALACTASPTSLCLNSQRFDVRVSWRVPSQGTSGVGMAQPLTSDTGYFWFFSSNNVELVIKVVDGRAFNNHFWVFYGALSDVEYTITVTDTQNGTVKTYTNPQGRLASVADTAAFPP